MKNLLLTVLAGFFFLQLTAQSAENITGFVLFKGYPYLVNMTPQGDILEFIQTAPEIMPFPAKYRAMEPPMPIGSYARPARVALEVYNSPLNSSDAADVVVLDIPVAVTNEVTKEDSSDSEFEQESKAQVQEQVSMEPKEVDDREMKTTVIRRTNEEASSPVVLRSTADASESEAGSYDLKFQGFTSRLTPTLINQLKDIYKEFQAKDSEKVTIRSFVTAGDNTNRKLAENRMAACRDLLETYGVPADRIQTKTEPYRSANSGQINISLD